jgi:cytochrome P450
MTTDTGTAESQGSSIVEMPLNHFEDERMQADPHAEWERLGSLGHRAIRSEAGPKPIWFLLDGEDIRTALKRWDLFSSRIVLPFQEEPTHTWIPEEVDPPLHPKYRQIFNEWFSPRRIKESEPAIRAWCVQLVEELMDRDEIDFVNDFALKFPGGYFMTFVGLPMEMMETFFGWMENIVEYLYYAKTETDPDSPEGASFDQPVLQYLKSVFDERRTEPRDDFFSFLLAKRIDDRPLNEDELLNIAILLYMAGLDTVASMLSFWWEYLADNPEHRQRIIDDPAITPNAVEELLRYFATTATGRLVTQDVEFAGCPMRQGDRVVLPAMVANRDERVYENAKSVDFDRPDTGHLTFAAGPHRCAGAHLARAELRIALEEWHKRIPHYEIADRTKVKKRGGGQIGVDSLPLRLRHDLR